MTAIRDFRAAMEADGLLPPAHIEGDDETYRCPTKAKPRKRNGAYCFDVRTGTGWYRDWSGDGELKLWPPEGANGHDPESPQDRAKRITAQKAAIEKRRKAAEAAAADAVRRWDKAKSAEPTHPYLKKKGISPNGLRQDSDILLVPVRDAEGKLHALQTIPPSGDPKLFGKGSATAGHYFTIGNLATTPAICLAEGYATAARIHEMTGCACIVTFSAHNLVSVTDTIAELYPDALLILCADDDHKTPDNPGLTHAKRAASHVPYAVVAVPVFGPERADDQTDFADMVDHDDVTEIINNAIAEAQRLREAKAKVEAEQQANGYDPVPPPNGEADYGRVQSKKRPPAEAPPEEPSQDEGSEPAGPEGARDDLPLKVTYADFLAYSLMGNFIFKPTGQLWPTSVVNKRLPWIDNGPDLPATSPATWLTKHQPVEQMTWLPGAPQIIRDRLLIEGGWGEHPQASVFNLYRPPTIEHGDPARAQPWVEHVRRIWPDDTEHMLDWFAQRVQYPEVKINHVLLLGGDPGIGKDTILEPVIQAVGPWNSETVSPTMFVGRFNGFLRNVLLRIAEARASQQFDRFAFYDVLKLYAASPPETIRVDEKNLREYSIANRVGIVITANRKSAFYLPPDDRRTYAAWSERKQADFAEGHFDKLWRWYRAGGFRHIAAYLAKRDLINFDPKAPPRKTEAFHDIVDTSRSGEDAEMADALDKLKNPIVVTLDEVARAAPGNFADWLRDRRNRRVIPHRFEANDYERVRNGDSKDGLWVIGGVRQAVFGRKEMDRRTLIEQVRTLQRNSQRR